MRSKSSNSQLSTQITLPIRIRPNDNSPHIQKNPPNSQNSMTTAKIQHQTSSQPLQHGKICFFPKNLNQFHKPTLRKTDNNSYNQLNLKKRNHLASAGTFCFLGSDCCPSPTSLESNPRFSLVIVFDLSINRIGLCISPKP